MNRRVSEEAEPALVRAETRFERRLLRPFQLIVIAFGAVAIVHQDWWLLATSIASVFFNGAVGSQLQKNRPKTLAELRLGRDGNAALPPPVER